MKNTMLALNKQCITALSLIFILLISLFNFSACNRKDLWDNKYLRATLSDVTIISAFGGNKIITADWIDPEVPYMNRIEITCSGVAGTITVLPGAQTCTITGLTNGVEYSVNIKVRDSYNNSSPGAKFSIKLTPTGTPVEGHFIYYPEDLDAVHGSALPQYAGWDLGDTYNLMADLDLSGYTNWDPIGVSANEFTGAFEGNNHTISNLMINRPAIDQGLFGFILNGTVNNLTLANVSVTATGVFDYTGSLAANCVNGSITNVSVSGTVSNLNGHYVGGLIGSSMGTTTITNCNVSVTVDGTGSVGGLAGECFGIGSVSGCTANGAVSGLNIIGGLAGRSDVKVERSHAQVNVTGVSEIGGLIGYLTGSIKECDASGSVTSEAGAPCINIGGLVGIASGGMTISGCHASGTVTAKGTTNDDVGGLVGQNVDVVIDNSYAAGDILFTGTISSVFVGGLIGVNGGNLTNCYAAGNTVQGTDTIGGLVGQNTAAITSCYSLNDVAVNTVDSGFIGGFVGDNAGLITDGSGPSYASGDVTVTLTAATVVCYIGGLVGRTNAAITNTHAYGNVDADLTLPGNGELYLGGLAGYSSVGAISGSLVRGAITVSMIGPAIKNLYVGGFIGTHINGNISDCSYNPGAGIINVICGNVDEEFVGGFIGDNQGGSVKYCSATGAVNCTDPSTVMAAGGFIGRNNNDISYCFATGNIKGVGNVGGLVGFNYPTRYISRCYATGNVTGTSNIGGLVGNNQQGFIQYCYAKGETTGPAIQTGGLIGLHDGVNNTSMYICYAVGEVDPVTGGQLVGELVTAGTYNYCYYNNENAGNNIGGIGMNTTQLRDHLNYSPLWLFGTDWLIDETGPVYINGGIPYILGLTPE